MAEPLCTVPPSYGLSFSELHAFGLWIRGPGLPLSAPPSATGRATALIFSASPFAGLSLFRLWATGIHSLLGLVALHRATGLSSHRTAGHPVSLLPACRLTECGAAASLLRAVWVRRGALSAPRAGDPTRPPPSGRAQLLSAPPRALPPQFSSPFLRWPTKRHLQTACGRPRQLRALLPASRQGHAASLQARPWRLGTAARSTGSATPYPRSVRPAPVAVWSKRGYGVWRGAAPRTSAASR